MKQEPPTTLLTSPATCFFPLEIVNPSGHALLSILLDENVDRWLHLSFGVWSPAQQHNDTHTHNTSKTDSVA